MNEVKIIDQIIVIICLVYSRGLKLIVLVQRVALKFNDTYNRSF